MATKPTPTHWDRMYNTCVLNYNFNKLVTLNDLFRACNLTQGEIDYVYPAAQLSQSIKSLGGIAFIKTTVRGLEELYTAEERFKDHVPNGKLQLGGYLEEYLPKRDKIDTHKADAIVTQAVTSTEEEDATDFPLSWTPRKKHPLQKCKLFLKQEKSAAQIYSLIVDHKKTGIAVDSPTGSGKTFMMAAVLRRMFDNGYIGGMPPVPYPVVWVTKASIVDQTIRVCEQDFGLKVNEIGGVLILNIEQFRAKHGKMYVSRSTKIESGEEVEHWSWNHFVKPHVFVLDESHILKNTDTAQSKIFQALNEYQPPFPGWPDTVQVHMSATLYSRVCDAKCFAVSTKIPFYGRPLSNVTWNDFAHEVASPAAPDDYVEAAVKRLTDKLDPYIVHVSGLRSQFKTYNRCKLIDFASEKERTYYHDAWKRYQAEKMRLKEDTPEGRMMILAQFTKFRMAAELCRAWTIAKIVKRDIDEGFQPIIAGCFKQYIGKVVHHLVYDFGIPRSQISIIWGGGAQVAAKSKHLKELGDEDVASLANLMKGMGMSDDIIRDTLKIKDGSEKEAMDQFNQQVADKTLGLGSQSKEERSNEIAKFQTGKAKVCLFTFKAGGVGLSLHHCDDFVPQADKVPRKESGYAIEEEIPAFVARTGIKPRRVYLTPTFSAVELVQGLGRGHRLTSLSHTDQTLLYYKGTIEVEVAATTNQKLKCLRQVVKQKDSWEDIIQHADFIKDTFETPAGLEEEVIEEDVSDIALEDDEDDE